jgi:uncharacterized RDD family membrane protein YckC
VLASVLDWMLWIPPAAILFYAALRRPELGPLCVGLWLVAKPAYEILMHGAFGATLGKMLVRIRVERADGDPMDLNAAIRRGFVSACIGLSAAMIAGGLLQDAALAPLPPLTSATPPEVIRSAIEKLLTLLLDNPGYRVLDQLGKLWWVLEWATSLTNARRRALHDYIGGTVVVWKSKG